MNEFLVKHAFRKNLLIQTQDYCKNTFYSSFFWKSVLKENWLRLFIQIAKKWISNDEMNRRWLENDRRLPEVTVNEQEVVWNEPEVTYGSVTMLSRVLPRIFYGTVNINVSICTHLAHLGPVRVRNEEYCHALVGHQEQKSVEQPYQMHRGYVAGGPLQWQHLLHVPDEREW